MRLNLLLLLAAGVMAAQETAGVYRVSFVVHETEGGKTVDTKNYSMLVQEGMKGVLRLGTKLPVPSGSGGTQYVDVGLNLDCMPRLLQPGQLSLNTEVEISSVQSETASPPRIRQVKTSTRTILAVGKPSTILSADDLGGKRHYDIEVTAAQMK